MSVKINYTSNQEGKNFGDYVYGSGNSLGKCLPYLLRLPNSAEWRFVSYFLEEK